MSTLKATTLRHLVRAYLWALVMLLLGFQPLSAAGSCPESGQRSAIGPSSVELYVKTRLLARCTWRCCPLTSAKRSS